MAVVTSAVIGAVASVGASAYSAYSSSQAGGGGSSGPPRYKRAPQDPLDRAMRSYYERANLANATKTYPSFGDYLTSGGDPALAKFDLEMPGLTPQEATAFGFTGGHGETIPTAGYEGLASGDVRNLSPEQILYLARQRRALALQTGQDVGPWASRVLKTNRRLGRVSERLSNLQDVEQPSPGQEQRIERLGNIKERLSERQRRQLNPDLPR